MSIVFYFSSLSASTFSQLIGWVFQKWEMNVGVLFMAEKSATTNSKRFNKNEFESGLENAEEKKNEKRNKFHIFQMDESTSGSSNNSSRWVHVKDSNFNFLSFKFQLLVST